MVEDIMRDAQTVAHGARVGDIIARAARAFAPGRRAVVIKLERYADHFSAGVGGQRGADRRIDPAAHRDDNPAFRRRARQVEQVSRIKPEGRAGRGLGRNVHDRCAI